MSSAAHKPQDLREACVQEALNIIEQAGLETLSLREVARRLGVSHQAPYKHFPSREHILAEVVRRAFDAFASYLDARPQHENPQANLAEMGQAYLEYARLHPLQYRLMFSTPLPDPHTHPEMMRSARHAFHLLAERVHALHPQSSQTPFDALFVWSTVHGLASILHSHAFETLGWSAQTIEQSLAHVLSRIHTGLDA